MAFKSHIAQRKKAKSRVALAGPSGSGKTLTALLIAYGLVGDWTKIGMIDCENNSGDLYSHLGHYECGQIAPPFTPEKYVEAVKYYEEKGLSVVIIDSLTHAWTGEGGVLDIQGKIADSGKGNPYTAWRFVTPKHNALVDAMLQSKCHIIATMRSKTAYIQQNKGDKVEVKKVGMEPIQRDGMEYEFTVFFDLDHTHTASCSKDRTGLFDGKFFTPSIETGKILKEWLDSGAEEIPQTNVTTAEVKAAPASAEKTNVTALKTEYDQSEPTTDPIINEYVHRLNKAKTRQEVEKLVEAISAEDSYKNLSDDQRVTVGAYANTLVSTLPNTKKGENKEPVTIKTELNAITDTVKYDNCVKEMEPAKTLLDLQTAWTKIKESNDYKTLSEDLQSKVKKYANTLKRALLNRNGEKIAA